MELAEIVILLVVAAAAYAALAPLRRLIERAWLRRWRRGGRGAVIPLLRRGDGTYGTRDREDTTHGNQR